MRDIGYGQSQQDEPEQGDELAAIESYIVLEKEISEQVCIDQDDDEYEEPE